MTLTTVANALLTRVRAYSSGAVFTTANSSYGDYTVLDSTSEVAAVIDVAADSLAGVSAQDGQSQFGASAKFQEQHDLSVLVTYKRGTGETDDGELKAALTTLTDALLAELVRYPRLNGTSGVKRAAPIRRNPPFDIAPNQPEGAPSSHLGQEIFFRVWTEITPTYAESY